MKALFLFLLTLLALGGMSEAATHCVLSTATGAQTGVDWANAYKSLPTSLKRGDTYYIGAGSYGGHDFKDPVSAKEVITIKKATVADHFTEVGFRSEIGANPAVFTGPSSGGHGCFNFTTGYYTIDGQTGGGPGAWTTGFGIQLVLPGDGDQGIALGSSGSSADCPNVICKHLQFTGIGRPSTQGGSFSNEAVGQYSGQNFVLSYYYIDQMGACPFFIGPTGSTVFEYGYIGKFYGSEDVHSEIASIWQIGSAPFGDCTFRYNIFSYVTSTGGLMWDNSSNTASHLYVYGNIFYQMPGVKWDQANGVIGGWSGGHGEKCYNILVYNNDFVTIGQTVLSGFPEKTDGCDARNNIWYGSGPQDPGIFSHDYNHFVTSGTPFRESHGSTGQENPFVSLENLNFALVEDTPPGDPNIPIKYRTDMYGKTGTSRGAIQFSTQSVPTPTPVPSPPPSATPSPTPTPATQTWEKWTKELNNTQSDWIEKHPPYPD